MALLQDRNFQKMEAQITTEDTSSANGLTQKLSLERLRKNKDNQTLVLSARRKKPGPKRKQRNNVRSFLNLDFNKSKFNNFLGVIDYFHC